MRCSGKRVSKVLPFLSRATGFIADPWLQIQFSRLIVQDRLRGVRDAKVDVTNMMTDLTVMISVEFPLLPQGVGLTLIGNKMIGISTVLGDEFRSTPGNQALTRDPSSCKVWSIGIELIEVATTEMCPQAAESTFQVQNALAEPSEPQ